MDRLVLRLLGGFQALRGGGEAVEVPGRKAQALLAFLALPPGVAHPRDKLAALLWPEMAATQARANLRLNVFALRRALAFADPLRLEGDTIALDAATVDVDAVAFETALARGEPDDLAAALPNYRGELLTGLRMQEPSFEEWLLAERERLRECAIDGLARLLAHQQGTGDRVSAAHTALRLLAMDPLQEPVHRALIRLYAGIGRRGDALRQYHVCVSVLRNELNVDPEVETRELYQEILRARVADAPGDTPGVRGAPDEPGELRWRPVEDVPFVGRARELSVLDEALLAAWSAEPRGIALIGDAGIGKSRLVGELVKLVLERGGSVATGQGYETEQVLPFRPWIDVLRSGPIARDRALLDDLTPRHRAALSQLLPEVDAPGGGNDQRLDFLRLFEAITSLVRAGAARQPLLVALEDLHWADEMSLRLLPFLCRHLRNDSLLVAVTLRDVPDAQPGVLRMLDELRRDWPMTLLPIHPLSRAETTTLAGHVAPRRSPPVDLDDRIWEASRGNPFIIVETLRALADSDSPASPGLPVAAGVRELIARRLDRLGEPGRRVIAAAAVIGQEFDFALVPPVAALDEEEAADGVEELVRHRLLRDVGGRFELVHDRIRQIVYDGIVSPRRALLHRRVAAALEAAHADNLGPHITALATHYRAAGAWREAAAYLERAGLAAAAHSAHMDAASLFEQALVALEHLPDEADNQRRQGEVRFRLGYSLSQAGRFAESLQRYETAIRLAEPLGHDEYLSLARAGRASVATSLARYDEARGLSEETYAAAVAEGDHRGQFWTLIQLARIDHAVGDYERSADYARSASACLERAPSIAAVGPLAPPDTIWRDWLLLDLAMLGAFDEAAAIVAERMRHGQERSDLGVNLRIVSASCVGVHHVARGDLDGALAVLEPTAELSRRTACALQFTRGAAALACAYVLADRAQDAVAVLEPVLAEVGRTSYAYLAEELECALGTAYLYAGRSADADRLLREALRRARASGARGLEAEVLRAMGDATSRGRAPDLQLAARYVTEAQTLADRLGMRPLGARCLVELARVRRGQGRVEESAGLLDRAIVEFRDMGMAFWLRRAEADLARRA